MQQYLLYIALSYISNYSTHKRKNPLCYLDFFWVWGLISVRPFWALQPQKGLFYLNPVDYTCLGSSAESFDKPNPRHFRANLPVLPEVWRYPFASSSILLAVYFPEYMHFILQTVTLSKRFWFGFTCNAGLKRYLRKTYTRCAV